MFSFGPYFSRLISTEGLADSLRCCILWGGFRPLKAKAMCDYVSLFKLSDDVRCGPENESTHGIKSQLLPFPSIGSVVNLNNRRMPQNK